ncbi:TPA: glycosyltransferase [Photobacterium damselae]
MKKVLINASNLHVGGGIQVAASFINELANIDVELDLTFAVSSEVDVNLLSSVKDKYKDKYYIIDVLGIKKYTGTNQKIFSDSYDVCFTIFGPIYHKTNAKAHVTGFAQAWIAYPNNLVYKKLKIKEYLKYKLEFSLKEYFFKKSDYFIVEQNHIKEALCDLGVSNNSIFTVSNCISSIYDDKDSWIKLNNDIKTKENFTLGFIGRAYIHKNLDILKDVNEILLNKYNMSCDFLFTLTVEEMEQCGFTKLPNFKTVGKIDVKQCPSFYDKIDALIFPSLLECFSATPIEAMKMNKLVFASDLPFVSDVCKDAAYYFDPMDADDIAKTIMLGVQSPELNLEKIQQGKEIVNSLPTAQDRAKNYLDILKNI